MKIHHAKMSYVFKYTMTLDCEKDISYFLKDINSLKIKLYGNIPIGYAIHRCAIDQRSGFGVVNLTLYECIEL